MAGRAKTANAPVEITRSGYSITAKGGEDETAEVKMYGEVVRSRPVDVWTGEKIKGNFIIEDEIIADLEKLAGKKEIRIRMNSVGGECNSAIVIHNRLRELSVNGTRIVCVVDGVAMSAGSHIMCAADVVRASSGSLIMVHKSSCVFFARMNADELRQAAIESDAYDKVIVEAYKRKTGKSEEELLEMMSAETYMTGREAKEKGFVDELAEGGESVAQIAASADRKTLYCDGRAMFLGNMRAPDFIPTVIPPADNGSGAIIEEQSGGSTDGNKTGGNLMANNLKELRTENSALADTVEADVRAEIESAFAAEKAEAVNKAIADERQRLSDIDEIASLYKAELVREAKYGDGACSAAELALRAAKQQAKAGDAFMEHIREDFENSGANDVGAAPEPNGGGAMTEAQRRSAIDASIDEIFKEGE